MNTRRDFIKTGMALGAASYVLSDVSQVLAASPAVESGARSQASKPVLVAVREGSRVAMLDAALAELGGIQSFVKAGQTVVIKPNIGWNAPPERGSNTHPELVAAMVTLCLKAGAKSVSVFDKTCDKWTDCYERSGIAAAVKAAGGQILPGNDESYYQEVSFPKGRVLKSGKVHRLVLESDVFVNMPVLKHHGSSLMTASMKNLMGVIWDRGFYHKENLHQCIADFLTLRRPDINILDAYHPMFRNGPRGKTPEDTMLKKMLFASRDIVAIDAAGAKVLDYEPAKVTHLAIGQDMGIGLMDLGRVDIRRHSLA